MAQRLVFETRLINDIVRTFDTMYVPDKLYDYANYITLYGADSKLYFEMCVILDGASNDAMVKLWEEVEGLEPFDPLTINFAEFKSIVKSIKSDDVVLNVDNNKVTIEGGRTKHVTELSTVTIPAQITETLTNFFDNSQKTCTQLVDFNLVKLYNNMNDIGTNLTINTLKADLYGVMNLPNMLVSTDGFSMTMVVDKHLNETFMFPKHSLRILKMLPKVGAKYAIEDHRIYIGGVGFQCYIGEWSGFKTYPSEALSRLLNSEFTEVEDGNGVITACQSCHQFDEVAFLYLSEGRVTNKSGTHVEYFEPTQGFGTKPMLIHKSVINHVQEVEHLYVNIDRFMGKVETGNKVHIFMGMRNEE